MVGIPLASVLGAPTSGIILDHAHWFGLSTCWPALQCGRHTR